MKRKILISSILTLLMLQVFAVKGYAVQYEVNKVLDTPKCVQLIMRSGEVIKAEIIKITEQTIDYYNCGTSSPLFSVSKSKVLSIQYPDGSTVKIEHQDSESYKGLVGSIISFVLGLIGLFFLRFILGLTALIWGIISLNKQSKSGSFGKGFSIAAIVLGAIDVILAILVLLIYLAAA